MSRIETPFFSVDVAGVDVDEGMASVRLTPRSDLNGPVGILQGGMSTAALVVAARAAEGIEAPLTSVEANLRAPTPVNGAIIATVQRDGVATYRVSTATETGVQLVDGRVVLQGNDTVQLGGDLAELAELELGAPYDQQDFPTCWVCGSANPTGIGMLPVLLSGNRAVSSWLPGADYADERDRLYEPLVPAILDCPAVWAAWQPITEAGGRGALLASMRVQPVSDAGPHEILRAVAVTDAIEGRKIRSRTALVDEDGRVYASASLLSIIVEDVPSLPPSA